MEVSAETKVVYIYGLFDPREPEHIRYVGKSNADRIRGRIHTHKKSVLYEKSKVNYRLNWLKKLEKQQVKFEYRIIEVCTSLNWQEKERYWIKKLKEEGHKLTNSTAGGDGCIEPTPELRKKLSESHKGNKSHLGIPCPEHLKKHFSEIFKGRKQYENQKKAIKKYNESKGKGYAQPKSKLYNINGEFLSVYGISKKFGICRETILKRMENGESIEQAIQKNKRPRKARKYNFNGTYLTLNEASENYKINFNTLKSRIARGQDPSIAVLLFDKDD